MPDVGNLKVQVYSEDGFKPIQGATITILGQKESSVKERVETDNSGKTQKVEVDTPPIEYSLEATGKVPYGLCNVIIDAPGFEAVEIKGCQIYPNNTAIQNCSLKKVGRKDKHDKHDRKKTVIDIKDNKLVGDFPPKIPENPDKEIPMPFGTVKLPKPVIPEFIVVHDGTPKNKSAKNYTVKYKDYIKNVASSEIFATWPESTIKANIMCIISFTLNRIYSEWYRGKGYNFQITSSTAYDHAFSYGRNIYENISRAVDEVFSTYIKRVSRKEPLLTQYCDGKKVKCPGWMTQWGSKELGDQGKNPYQIITNFYGNEVQFVKAETVKGIPKSYPGYNLKIGSKGSAVRTVQTQLNGVSKNFPAIPKVKIDSAYGSATAASVKKFQEVFNLPQTGVVDYATWYKISDIYVAVSKISELRNEYKHNGIFIPPNWTRDEEAPKIEYPCDY